MSERGVVAVSRGASGLDWKSAKRRRVMWIGLGAPIATRRVCAVTPARARAARPSETQVANSVSEYTNIPGMPVVPAVAKT
jgi:hypothetical protein